jgi:hypothetical protein
MNQSWSVIIFVGLSDPTLYFCFIFLGRTKQIKKKGKTPLLLWTHRSTDSFPPADTTTTTPLQKKKNTYHHCGPRMSLGVLTVNGREVCVTALEHVFMEDDFCDARNPDNEWLAARVVAVDATKLRVLVEFVDCPDAEWVRTWYPLNSDRLAVYTSHSRQKYFAPLFHTYTAQKPKDTDDLLLTRHTVQNNKYNAMVKSRSVRRQTVASLQSDQDNALFESMAVGTQIEALTGYTALVAGTRQSQIEKLEGPQEVEYLEIKSTETYRLRSGVSQLLPWFAQPVVWHHYPAPEHILSTHTRYSVTDAMPLSSTDEALAVSCHRWMREMNYIGPTLRASVAGTRLSDRASSVDVPFIGVEELD